MREPSEIEILKGAIRAMETIIEQSRPLDLVSCKFCQSLDVVKNGKRNGTQYWLCRNCGRGFVANKALPGMRYPMDTIAKGVYDYYAGVSLNKIREGIEQQWGLSPSDSAIYGWVKKLTKTGLAETKKHIPEVGDVWIADETVIKLKDGQKYWLINVIDRDTRFLLTSKLSRTRTIKDVISAFESATRRAGGLIPKAVLTDGWKAYEDGLERLYGADTKHFVSTPFTKKELSTNIVERWHGTLKDRLKPMRGMDKSETRQLILEGFILYYNYLRPHESLNGKTPAEAAKERYPFKSWGDIIRSEMPEPPKPKPIDEILHPKPYRKRTPIKKKVRTKKTNKKPPELGLAR